MSGQISTHPYISLMPLVNRCAYHTSSAPVFTALDTHCARSNNNPPSKFPGRLPLTVERNLPQRKRSPLVQDSTFQPPPPTSPSRQISPRIWLLIETWTNPTLQKNGPRLSKMDSRQPTTSWYLDRVSRLPYREPEILSIGIQKPGILTEDIV